MTEELERKLNDLKRILADGGRVVVAFSGGVDSCLLLNVAHEVLGDNVLAVTVSSPLMPHGELKGAQSFCEARGIRLEIVDVDQLACEELRLNPANRCYVCKGIIFDAIIDAARESGFDVVVDGSNADDALAYRPGAKALEERGVMSPLAEANIAKADVRMLLREMGESVWWKPSNACLATRLEYGAELHPEMLRRIDEAEAMLRDMGFEQVRVRVHGDLARIEVNPGEISQMAEVGTRLDVVQYLEELGFTYVCVDLKGFRSGSMDVSLG